tara:strand:+ start:891 stop:1094 length:204 start_codon:yes stop_codon:yes gene_type:complete
MRDGLELLAWLTSLVGGGLALAGLVWALICKVDGGADGAEWLISQVGVGVLFFGLLSMWGVARMKRR